jgi:hypothetical protein
MANLTENRKIIGLMYRSSFEKHPANQQDSGAGENTVQLSFQAGNPEEPGMESYVIILSGGN